MPEPGETRYDVSRRVAALIRSGDVESARCLAKAFLEVGTDRYGKAKDEAAVASDFAQIADAFATAGAVAMAEAVYTSYRVDNDTAEGKLAAADLTIKHASFLLRIGQRARATTMLIALTENGDLQEQPDKIEAITTMLARSAREANDPVATRKWYEQAVAAAKASRTGYDGKPTGPQQPDGKLLLEYATVLAEAGDAVAADAQYRQAIAVFSGSEPTRPEDEARTAMTRYAEFLRTQGRTQEAAFQAAPDLIGAALAKRDYAAATKLSDTMTMLAATMQPRDPARVQLALEMRAVTRNDARGNRQPPYSPPPALLKCGPWVLPQKGPPPPVITMPAVPPAAPLGIGTTRVNYIWPAIPGDPDAALLRSGDHYVEYAGRCRAEKRPADALAVLEGAQKLFVRAGHEEESYRRVTLALAAARGQAGDFSGADRIYTTRLARMRAEESSDFESRDEIQEIINFYVNNGRYDRAEMYYLSLPQVANDGGEASARLLDLYLLQGKVRQARQLVEKDHAYEPALDFSSEITQERANSVELPVSYQSDLTSSTLGMWNEHQASLGRMDLLEGNPAAAAEKLTQTVAFNDTYFAELKKAGREVWPFLPRRVTQPLFKPLGDAWYELGEFAKARDAYKMAVATKANDVAQLNERDAMILAETLVADAGRYAETIARSGGSQAEVDKMIGFADELVPMLPNAGQEAQASLWHSQVVIGLLRQEARPRALDVGNRLYGLLETQWAIGSQSALDVEWQKRQLRAAAGRYTDYASLLWAVSDSGRLVPRRDAAFAAVQRGMQDTTDLAIANAAARSLLARAHPELLPLIERRDALVASYLAGSSNNFSGSVASDAASTAATELAAIDVRLRKDAPDYIALIRSDPLKAKDASALMGADEAMLLLLPGEFDTHLVAITREKVSWHQATMPRKEIAAAVRRLLWFAGGNVVTTPQEAKDWAAAVSGGLSGFDRQTAFALYQALIKPALADIAGKKQLFIAASGSLSSLPFSILVSQPPIGRDDDPSALRATAWFADDFALTKVPSLQTLALLRGQHQSKARPASLSFAGFGDPALSGRASRRGARGATQGSAPSADSVYATDSDDGEDVDATLLAGLARLPGTSVELKAMARAFAAPEDAVHLFRTDTESQLKQTDLSTVNVLAFATHGLTAGELRGVRMPGLVFTPPATPSAQDDGYLSSSEIALLKLNADWVILSACNTASGDGTRGAPGMSGLARAFFYAGARNLLASHWPVRDDVASVLTVRAVEIAQRNPALSRAQALQQAMSEVRSDEAMDGVMTNGINNSWAHPSAWAPFSLIGGGN